MASASDDLVVRGGRVIEPSSGFDQVCDILLRDGRIERLGRGESFGVAEDCPVVDATGRIVTAGLIDLHLHGFGALGFSDLDSVGVEAGCTTVADAGGAGVLSLEDFFAQLAGAVTGVYSWLYVGPEGIADSVVGKTPNVAVEQVVRDLPIEAMARGLDAHRDRILGLKVAAFGPMGARGPMRMVKGLAETLGLRLYVHVGDLQDNQPPPLDLAAVMDVLDENDIVTHCYSSMPNSLFNTHGKLLPSVADAMARGVQFDLGAGAFNFDFDLARRGMDVGLVPATLSSDLQLANVTGPTFSLANVMSTMLALGMDLDDVVARVTTNAAKVLGSDDVGVLRAGAEADLTILELSDESATFADTTGATIEGHQVLRPAMAIRAGRPVEVHMERAQKESNWSRWSAFRPDVAPDGSMPLTAEETDVCQQVHRAVTALASWDPLRVHAAVDQVVGSAPVGRARAGRLLLGLFLDPVFPQSPGFYFATLDRALVQERLGLAAAGAGVTVAGETS